MKGVPKSFGMNVEVTAQDIRSGGRGTVDNPITRALTRATGTKWCIFQGNIAYGLTPPHRSLPLPAEVCSRWQNYQNWGYLEPFAFDLGLDSDTRPAGLSAQERRNRSDRRGPDRREGERRTTDRRHLR